MSGGPALYFIFHYTGLIIHFRRSFAERRGIKILLNRGTRPDAVLLV